MRVWVVAVSARHSSGVSASRSFIVLTIFTMFSPPRGYSYVPVTVVRLTPRYAVTPLWAIVTTISAMIITVFGMTRLVYSITTTAMNTVSAAIAIRFGICQSGWSVNIFSVPGSPTIIRITAMLIAVAMSAPTTLIESIVVKARNAITIKMKLIRKLKRYGIILVKWKPCQM